MKKKNWKKTLLTNLVIFLVIAILFVLSFFTADNQMKNWIKDNDREVVNFTYQYGTKGYVPEDNE